MKRVTNTSKEAFLKVEPETARMRRKVLQAMKKARKATGSELSKISKIDILSVRPRLTELRDNGRIIESGHYRYNRKGNREIVWAAV